MRQATFRSVAGDAAVVFIAPSAIDSQLLSKWPVGRERLRKLSHFLPRYLLDRLRPAIRRAEPFAIPPRFFAAAVPVEETRRFALLADLAQHRADPRASLWYREMMDALRQKGSARYKTRAFYSEEEILTFLTGTMFALFDSIRTSGFNAAESAYDSCAVIGPGGKLIKTGSGNHRFCISRLVGLKSFPVTIVGACESWLVERFPEGYDVESVLEALREIAEAHNDGGELNNPCAK